MAVEISKYGGTHAYFTKSIHPEGPWTEYGSKLLFNSAFKIAPGRISYATVIFENSEVIQPEVEFSIMYLNDTKKKKKDYLKFDTL